MISANGEPFKCLYADPAWPFGDKLPGPGRGAAKHYREQPVDQILKYVEQNRIVIADDAWLFLWRVGSQQKNAIAVAEAWGFEEPTSEVVWGKKRIGMGRTVRNSHEVCLICRRGKVTASQRDVKSYFFEEERGSHSAKPQRMYSIIEDLVGGGPYLELNARQRHLGWWSIGDELHKAETNP